MTMTYTITARGVLTTLCWITGFALATASMFVEFHLGALANAFLMVAGVSTVRTCLTGHFQAWFTAYEAGREVGKIRHLG